ncbi:Aste57867_19088 [Aphanomyces stellatus]|uniref:Aste57867_19088 protein n=1 Tax=Aphanomyces stellatus TaxID=120398 RepID=A0A485LBY8_9STRA|nr:hypothetical protein As57867_019024 [Aphanomyces stellatus]VFT95813.1 Aste57867_19088 [Aphanomyces stellatus]
MQSKTYFHGNDTLFHSLSPQQNHDVDALAAYVASHEDYDGANYSKAEVAQALAHVNWSTPMALDELKRRDNTTKPKRASTMRPESPWFLYQMPPKKSPRVASTSEAAAMNDAALSPVVVHPVIPRRTSHDTADGPPIPPRDTKVPSPPLPPSHEKEETAAAVVPTSIEALASNEPHECNIIGGMPPNAVEVPGTPPARMDATTQEDEAQDEIRDDYEANEDEPMAPSEEETKEGNEDEPMAPSDAVVEVEVADKGDDHPVDVAPVATMEVVVDFPPTSHDEATPPPDIPPTAVDNPMPLIDASPKDQATEMTWIHYLSRRLHAAASSPHEDDADDHAIPPLEQILSALAVHWTPETLRLAEAFVEALTVAYATQCLEAAEIPLGHALSTTESIGWTLLKLLPPVGHAMDLGVSPTDHDVRGWDDAALAMCRDVSAPIEDQLGALNAACRGHMERLDAFAAARAALASVHVVATAKLDNQLAAVAQVVQSSQGHVAAAATDETQRRADDDAAAAKLQLLVQTHCAELVASGEWPNVALTRAQLIVLGDTMIDDDDTTAARGAFAGADAAAVDAVRVHKEAVACDAVVAAAHALLVHVVGQRQAAMSAAMMAMDAAVAAATAHAMQKLEHMLPLVVALVARLASALSQRIQYASDHAQAKRDELAAYVAIMGALGPAHRKSLEAVIVDFETAGHLTMGLVATAAVEQQELWSTLLRVATDEVVQVLGRECGRHMSALGDGPLRDVLAQFATPDDALEPEDDDDEPNGEVDDATTLAHVRTTKS